MPYPFRVREGDVCLIAERVYKNQFLLQIEIYAVVELYLVVNRLKAIKYSWIFNFSC